MSQTDSPSPFKNWMLKEIYEQPQTIRATLAQYANGDGFLETAAPIRDWLREQKHLVFAASGSSRHASLYAEIRIEELSPLPVDVEYASETIYSSAQTHSKAGVIVVSQSGETADTLSALRQANEAGRPTLSITNVANSTMTREADIEIVTNAGRERAIPATKSFTAQLFILEMLAVLSAQAHRSITEEKVAKRLSQMAELPDHIEKYLPVWQNSMEAIAQQYGDSSTFLFLGRGINHPIAREGALKLKESAYIAADAYPAGEFKHGPNALVSPDTPLVMLAAYDEASPSSRLRYERVLQLTREMRAQGATILAIANEGDTAMKDAATTVIPVPSLAEGSLAMAEVIPLQMLSYFVALYRGIDPDRPRNLAKAVLAE